MSKGKTLALKMPTFDGFSNVPIFGEALHVVLHEGNTNARSCSASLHALQKQRQLTYRPSDSRFAAAYYPYFWHLCKIWHADAGCWAVEVPSSRLRDFCSLHTQSGAVDTQKLACTCTNSAHIDSNAVPHPLEPGADWCLHVLGSSQLIVVPTATFGNKLS